MRSALTLLSLPLVMASSPAFAQDATQVAAAETLYKEGVRLLQEGKVAEACPKLAESQRLDPGGGTLFRLAECHEKQGKLASAWVGFGEVARLAQQKGKVDIERDARAHMASLEPRLSKLTMTAPPGELPAGIEVKLDGKVIGVAVLGVALPLDPGEHVVEVSAPGKQPVRLTVQLGASADKQSVALPALKDAAAAPGPAAPASAPPPAPSSPPAKQAPPQKQGVSPLVYVSGGVAVVGLAVGSVFGLRALSKTHAANEVCPTAKCNDLSAVQSSKDGASAALLSDIGFGVGLLGAAAMVYLLTSSPGEASARVGRTSVSPVVGSQGGGLLLRGGF